MEKLDDGVPSQRLNLLPASSSVPRQSLAVDSKHGENPMRNLAANCQPRASVFDKARRDTVLDLTDLIQNRIDPEAFFRENHLTEGMRILLTEGFRRLEGRTIQGVFKLTQAMGGVKPIT